MFKFKKIQALLLALVLLVIRYVQCRRNPDDFDWGD